MKMKNRAHIYNINVPWPRQWHKHTKCKVFLSDDPYT